MDHKLTDYPAASRRQLSDYWTAFCALVLVLTVVYAVFTAN